MYLCKFLFLISFVAFFVNSSYKIGKSLLKLNKRCVIIGFSLVLLSVTKGVGSTTVLCYIWTAPVD